MGDVAYGPRVYRCNIERISNFEWGSSMVGYTRRYQALLSGTINYKKHVVGICVAAMAVVLPVAAPAQTNEPVMQAVSQAADKTAAGGNNAAPSGWDTTLGLGLGVRPTYEGSDDSSAVLVPWVDATYNNWLSFNARGANVFLQRGNWRVGAGLTLFQGRSDSDSKSLLTRGDDRLAGMGDLDDALATRAFASYRWGRVNYTASIAHSLGNSKVDDLQIEGTQVKLVALAPFQISRRLTLLAGAGATWADSSYLRSMFGVTRLQATRSRFSRYKPDAGLKDVRVSAGASWAFNRHWSLMGILQMKKLLGDAADSPLVYDATSTTFITTLNYHF